MAPWRPTNAALRPPPPRHQARDIMSTTTGILIIQFLTWPADQCRHLGGLASRHAGVFYREDSARTAARGALKGPQRSARGVRAWLHRMDLRPSHGSGLLSEFQRLGPLPSKPVGRRIASATSWHCGTRRRIHLQQQENHDSAERTLPGRRKAALRSEYMRRLSVMAARSLRPQV